MTQVAGVPSASANSTAVIAIDVLIEPGATLQATAKSLNALLRKDYPRGFALDESHVPHLSLLHRFVRVSDLPKVFAAVEKVLAQELPLQWQLTADGLESAPWGGQTMTSIRIRKTPELSALQRELVNALNPFAVHSGDASAFVRTADSSDINAATIDYVKTFVPKRTGENFQPHITAGQSTPEFARKLPSTGFNATSRPRGVAIYQLGNAGTARKQLWRIDDAGV